MKAIYLRAILLGAGICAASAGNAADITPLTPEAKTVESQSGWQFTFAPYFWAAGLSGDIGQFGLPEVHIDADFGDILNNLDFAFMAAGEARYDRFSIVGDVIYTKLGADADTPAGILADSVDVTSKTFAGLLGVGYAVLEDQDGHLDVVGGMRVWSAKTEISFNGGILAGVDVEDSATWVDAVAGLRGNYFFTPEIYVTGWGLVAPAAPISTGMWRWASATSLTTPSQRSPDIVHSASTTIMTGSSSTSSSRGRLSGSPFGSNGRTGELRTVSDYPSSMLAF